MKKENIFYLLITLIALAAVYFVKDSEFMTLMELKTIDFRASAKSSLTEYKDKTVIVGISDTCLKKIDEWPFPRAWYGYLTSWLAKGKIKGIMFDLIFSGTSSFGREDQNLFEKNIKKSAEKTSVVIGCDLGLRQIMDPETWETKTVLDYENTHDLSPALKGSVNMGNLEYMNPDSILRFIPLVYKSTDKYFPALSTALFIRSRGIKNPVFEIKKGMLTIKGTLADKSSFAYEIPCIVKDMSGSKLNDPDSVVAYTLLSREKYLKQAEYFEIADLLPGALNHWAVASMWQKDKKFTPGEIDKFRKILEKALQLAEKNENPKHEEIIKNNLSVIENANFSGLKEISPPGAFLDSHVTVMGTGTGLFDLYPSSIDGKKIPGGWIHASLLRQLIKGDTYRIINSNLLIPAVLCLLVFLTLTIKSNVVSFICFSLVIGIFFFGTWGLFFNNFVINFSQSLLSAVLAYGACILLKLVIFQKRTRQLKSIFSKYVSPDVAGKIMSEKDNISLKGTYYNASVLFLDVCGFTSYSEQNTPEEVFMTLNEYFDFITEIIFENNGTLDKFIGDAVMAVFGVPVKNSIHAEQALNASIEIQKKIFEFNRQNADRGMNLTVSIGIATGKMVAGNIGSKKRMDYTVIGDTVNLAARLEAKATSGEIIISESTWTGIDGNSPLKQTSSNRIKSLEPFSVKGKKNLINAFSLDMNPS